MFFHLSRVAAHLSLIVALAVPEALSAGDDLPEHVVAEFGSPPAVPEGALSAELSEAVRSVFVESVAPVGSETQIIWGTRQSEALEEIAASGDPRLAWLITDLMRFVWQNNIHNELAGAAGELLQTSWSPGNAWNQIIDHLIAWDIAAPPDYLTTKRAIYTTLFHGWDRLFVEGDVDWRHVTWGGVPADARPFDETHIPCNCIPAADNPTVTNAAEATWLRDDDIVFGIEINGEARAYPRQIMVVFPH